MIPDHIASAIDSERTSRKTFANDVTTISAGDIRRVGSGDLERLALVLKVNSETNSTQFTLVHSYVEFATEHDIIVEPAATNLPYSIVVETDLRAAVSTAELGALVAIVPSRIVAACFEGPTNFVEVESTFIGPTMLGPLDARWDFKAEEGEVIRELSSAVIDSTVNESGFGQIKFDHLLRTLLPHSENPTEMALQTYELWISGDVQFTIEHLELFAERDLLTSRIWEDALGVAGEQFFKMVIVDMHEKLICGSTAALISRGLVESNELQYA